MLFDLLHPPGPGPVLLGPLTGAAELGVAGTGAADAIGLIDRCLAAHPGSPVAPGEAARLSTSDRDRLMARLYQRSFGSKIEGVSVCHGCGARFDFDFHLDGLMEALIPDPAEADPEGWYALGDNRFRLPQGVDELAALGLPSDQAAALIAERCAPKASDGARAEIEARVAEIAPLVDLTLDATCPECGAANPMAFGAERYFLTRLRNERHALMRDIHLLAATYHWPLDTITGLTREDRQALVAQIARDRDALRKAGAA